MLIISVQNKKEINKINMNNRTNGLIKGMAVGAAIATAVTMVVSNKKTMVKKAKAVVENTSDSVTSFLNKMH